jgi:hypothetical protein
MIVFFLIRDYSLALFVPTTGLNLWPQLKILGWFVDFLKFYPANNIGTVYALQPIFLENVLFHVILR